MTILILIFILLGVEVSHAQPISSPPGVIAGETDGTNRQRYREIKFTTGTTTNNADGSMTVDNSPVSATGWTDLGAQVVLTTSSDNVGVGTINPEAKLHVKGGIIADGSFSGMLLGNNMKIDGDTTRKMTFSQTAGTYNENVRFDLDTTTNTLAVDSTTGVTDIDMSPFTVTASAFVGDGSGLTGISGGSGGVGIGTTGWMPYYAANGSNVVASNNIQLVGANVGIGTSTASQKLTVTGNQIINSTGALYFGDTSKFLVASATTNGNIDFYTASSLKRMSIQNGGSVVINDDSTDDIVPFRVETNTDANALYADGATNNIGIGTVGPVSKLQVNGTVTAIAFSGDGSALTGISSSGGGWQDGGTNVYLTATSDNVGIGTTTPTSGFKLDVRGNQYVSGLVGIGTVSPASAFEVVQSTFANSGTFTRTTSNTTGVLSAGKLNARSSGSTTDGFGPLFAFTLEDTSLTNAPLGYIGAVRAGADNTGDIVISPSVTGTPTEGLRVMSGGNVGIGTSKPLALVSIGTGIAVADYTNVGAGDVYIKNDLEVDGTLYGNGSGLTGIAGWVDGGTNIYASPTTDNVAIGTTTPTQKLTVVGTVSATAFVGDGSGLTGVGASGWTDAGTSIFPTATSDQIAIGTTTPVSGAALTVLGTIAGSGSGPLSITNGNVGIGTFATPTVLLHVGNTAGSPTSVGANDVYIQNDLEVDGTIYGNGAGLTNAAGWTDGTNVVYTTVAADKVGIGTSTPNRLLAIHTSDPDTYPSFGVCNSVGECFRVEANSTNDTSRVSIGSAQNVSLDFNANDVTLLKLESSGNVGIGTVGSGGAIFVSPDNTCSKCGPNNSDVWACASVACP